MVKDAKEAVKWWRLAAEQGNADAQFGLGACCSRGIGVVQDEKEAMKWWRLAAEQGNAAAQGLLAGAYFYGDGVIEDHQAAYAWLVLAIDNGFASPKASELKARLTRSLTKAQIEKAHLWARERFEAQSGSKGSPRSSELKDTEGP